MELLKGPIWDLESNADLDPDEKFVRIKLYKDSVVAEFTIAELCSFFGIDGFDCLQRQFKAWYDLNAFAWDSKNKVHCEQIAFSEYFVLSKIHECYSPQPLPETTNGIVRWGMKKGTHNCEEGPWGTAELKQKFSSGFSGVGGSEEFLVS